LCLINKGVFCIYSPSQIHLSQIHLSQIHLKLEEKTAEAEQVALLKIKLKNATVQRDESQDKELENAISKILGC
jgi:hypothetical protein